MLWLMTSARYFLSCPMGQLAIPLETSSIIFQRVGSTVIEDVALRLRSERTSVPALVASWEFAPLRAREGTHDPAAIRTVGRGRPSLAIFPGPHESQALDAAVRAMRPLLEFIASQNLTEDVEVDLLVALVSRPLGFVVDLSPECVRLLSDANAGIVVDAYDRSE